MKISQTIFWNRIADAHLFTWGYLVFHVFAMVSMRLFLNSANFLQYLTFWLFILLIEHLLIFIIYGLAKKFINNYSAPLIVVGSLAIGVVRTLLTTSLAIAIGADSGVAWTYQLLLGSLWELTMAVLWANLNGAFREHSKIVRQLNQTKDSILGYRENAELTLAEEQDKLIELTRTSLLPQIQLIEQAVDAGNAEMAARWSVAHELKGFIYNQVRPLSETLRLSAKALTAPPMATPNHFFSVVSIPRSFTVKNSIFPLYTFAAIFLAFLATPFWLLDISWVVPSALLSLSYLGVIAWARWLLRNLGEVPAWLGIIILAIVAVAAAVPSYLAALLFYPNTHQAVFYGSALVYSSMFVITTLALLDSFDYQARLYRDVLTQQNSELATEVALFDQQHWLARKNWSTVIHGTVQASLTAALTRLNEPNANKATLNLAKKDLERAIEALSNPPKSDIKFASALKEIVSTWQGVCEVNLDFQPEAKRVVSRDSRLGSCVNELIKEAVSNAVRHGDARTAQVSMNIDSLGALELKVANDGYAPRLGGRRGIGSRLLDELSVDWSLSFDSTTDQTILTARLPFSVSQA